MMMFKNFCRDDTGAITTDWVAMTSALIVVAIVVIFSLFSEGITPLTGTINSQIESGSQELCGGDAANCDVISR